ncbi:unnamed protein product [Oreochromis niloticus]|nr:unnamed protein product [Mustela putorius furo]
MAAVTVCSTTKGLFLMFTLLSLVCFSSSLIDKNQLKQLKESYQKIKQQMDRLKAGREKVDFSSELMSEYLRIMDPLIALMKKSDGFPQLNTFMEYIKNFVKESKANIDRDNEELGEEIEESEMKLEQLRKIIEVLEEKQAEL